MEQIDAKQELAFIKKVMADSRNDTVDNGLHFITWGILVALGQFGTYGIIVLNLNKYCSLWLWTGIVVLGWPVSWAMAHNHRKKERVKTFAGRLLGNIWLAFGITAVLVGFAGGFTGRGNPNPVVAAVMGMAYYLSGLVLGQRFVKYLGFVWWSGAVLMFVWSGLHQFLVFGSMMILFQVIPGVVLYRQWKRTGAQSRDCGTIGENG
jgi:hypothetical protein